MGERISESKPWFMPATVLPRGVKRLRAKENLKIKTKRLHPSKPGAGCEIRCSDFLPVSGAQLLVPYRRQVRPVVACLRVPVCCQCSRGTVVP